MLTYMFLNQMVKSLKYFLPLLLIVPLYSQGVTLSQEEMLGIANNIKELQHSDSMKTVSLEICDELIKEMEQSMRVDSLILVAKNSQIVLLKARDEANEKMVRLVEPKWYENQYLWLGIGFVLGKI